MGLAVDGANLGHDMKLVTGHGGQSASAATRTQSGDPPGRCCLDKGYDFGEVRRTLDVVRLHGAHPQPVAKRPRPSRRKLASKPAAGWWNALTVG